MCVSTAREAGLRASRLRLAPRLGVTGRRSVARGGKRGEGVREVLQPRAPDLANTAAAGLGRIDGPVLAHNDAVRISQLRACRGPTVS